MRSSQSKYHVPVLHIIRVTPVDNVLRADGVLKRAGPLFVMLISAGAKHLHTAALKSKSSQAMDTMKTR